MKLKIGRNAPCSCGSGKKFKNCCLGKSTAENKDLLYEKLQVLHDQLVPKLFKYASEFLGPDVLLFAWENFVFYEDEEYDDDSLHNQLFYPWMLYHWIPDADFFETENDYEEWGEITIAESFAEDFPEHLSEMEKRFIDIVRSSPYSFYEIVKCQPGVGFKLNNVLSGQEIDVLEQMGSQMAQKNQLIFAQVIQYDSVGMLMGTGSYYFPPSYKIDVLELKAAIENEGIKVEEELFEWGEEIRILYFDLFDRITTPPQLANTDGDPLSLHELFYDIETPDTVFEKLYSLAEGTTKEELLEKADFNKQGNLLSINFPWLKKGNPKMKSWENTVLGQILIEKNQLIINVNSEKRAELIKRKIKTLLGNQAKYKTTKIQSAESLLDKSESPIPRKTGKANEDLTKIPEVKKMLDQQLSEHWQNWLSDKLPALNYKSPEEMVKDKYGREKVKALLNQFELNDENVPDHLKQKKFINQARKKLGL